MRKSPFLVVGKHAVSEALKNPNRKVNKVFLTEDSKKNLNEINHIVILVQLGTWTMVKLL